MKKTIEELPLKDLIDQTREHLKSLNYAKDTMRHYENAWTALKNYAEKEGIVYFTTEFGISFLKEKYNINPFDIGL